MAKTVNHSNKEYGLSPNRNWRDVLQEGDSHSFFPGRADEDKRLAYTLLTWTDNRNNLRFVDFLHTYRISSDTWYRKVRQSPELAKWFNEAKLYLADNRLNGAMKKVFDRESISIGLARLDPEVKEDLEFMADLKRKSEPETSNEDKNINITIHDNGYKTKEPRETL
jgi:hypothetical protein